MLTPSLITPPAADKPLVSLVEAKKHCNVDHGDDDDLITGLIVAATAWLDGYSGVLGRALVNQTWRLNLECWPACRIRLPLAPVSTISEITYWDTANVEKPLAATNFQLVEDALSPAIQWTRDAALPSLFERPDAINVRFVAGYGPNVADVPETIRLAARMLVAFWYANREATDEIPKAVIVLTTPFRRVGL